MTVSRAAVCQSGPSHPDNRQGCSVSCLRSTAAPASPPAAHWLPVNQATISRADLSRWQVCGSACWPRMRRLRPSRLQPLLHQRLLQPRPPQPRPPPRRPRTHAPAVSGDVFIPISCYIPCLEFIQRTHFSCSWKDAAVCKSADCRAGRYGNHCPHDELPGCASLQRTRGCAARCA